MLDRTVKDGLKRLGVAPVPKYETYHCKCARFCAAWSAHPLGHRLFSRAFNTHLYHAARAAVAANRLVPDGPARRSDGEVANAVRRAGHHPGRFLVALAPCGCGVVHALEYPVVQEPGMARWRAEHGAPESDESDESDEDTGGYRRQASSVEHRPFAMMLSWKPSDGTIDWSHFYEWVDELPAARTTKLRHAASPTAKPRVLIHAAPPLTLPAQGSTPPPSSPSSSSVSSMSTSSLDSTPPPAKRPRLSATRKDALGAARREFGAAQSSLQARLEADQQSEDDEEGWQRTREEREEADRRAAERARDQRWFDEYAARLEECRAEADPAVRLKLWDGWVEALGGWREREAEEVREREWRLRSREGGVEPREVDEVDVKVARVA